MQQRGFEEQAVVRVIEHPQGFRNGCKVCRRIFAEGRYVVGLEVGRHRYVLAPDPPIFCCKERKVCMRLFRTEKEAEQAQGEVMDVLRRDGTTASLPLVEVAGVGDPGDGGAEH